MIKPSHEYVGIPASQHLTATGHNYSDTLSLYANRCCCVFNSFPRASLFGRREEKIHWCTRRIHADDESIHHIGIRNVSGLIWCSENTHTHRLNLMSWKSGDVVLGLLELWSKSDAGQHVLDSNSLCLLFVYCSNNIRILHVNINTLMLYILAIYNIFLSTVLRSIIYD